MNIAAMLCPRDSAEVALDVLFLFGFARQFGRMMELKSQHARWLN
jgi:hypothetical protein